MDRLQDELAMAIPAREKQSIGVGWNWRIGVAAAVLIGGMPALAGAETARWDVDPDHSIIEFRVAHMVVSKTSGRFTDYRGFVEMDPDAKTFKTIEATINTASVNTNQEKRDAHLRNADFLDVQQSAVGFRERAA